jgi:hypothetical protein
MKSWEKKGGGQTVVGATGKLCSWAVRSVGSQLLEVLSSNGATASAAASRP